MRMYKTTYLYFSEKLLKVCDSNKGASIYSLIPELDHDFSHVIDNHSEINQISSKIFGEGIGVKSNSQAMSKLLANKEEIFKEFSNYYSFKKLDVPKISIHPNDVALALLSNVYLNSFIKPIQAFIPHSTSCSGQWNFWEIMDYSEVKNKLKDKNIMLKLVEKIDKSNVWDVSTIPLDKFTPINRRRIEKEKALEKPLDREGLIKAMIIRLGEIAAPSMRYETLDVAIRKYLRELDINKYLRVDVEMAFLLRLEDELKKTIIEISNI